MAHISYRVSGNHAGEPLSRRFPDTKEGRNAAQKFAKQLVGAKTAYDVRVRVGDREVSKTFVRRRDAHAYATTIEVDKLRGVVIDPRADRLTVEELGQRWLDSNPAKRPDTRATDEYHLRAHVNPVLGKRQIASVTPSHVQGLANDLSARLAPKTVRRALGVARAMFSHAVTDDLLGRSPCRGIKLPRVDPTRRRVPSSDELARLIGAIPECYQAMVYCAVVLGLRYSEVAGLRVREVDTLRGMLGVAETVTRDAQGRPVFGPPKSEASRRTLAIPPPLTELLAKHLALRGLSGADADALVFTAPAGGPIRYANWRNRVWLPACRAVGLDGLGFHDLRRANATALVRLGVDVKTAQQRLGHSDVRMTIGLYAQAEKPADRAAATRLGELFMANPRDGRGMSSADAAEAAEAQAPDLGL
jgi:integrase